MYVYAITYDCMTVVLLGYSSVQLITVFTDLQYSILYRTGTFVYVPYGTFCTGTVNCRDRLKLKCSARSSRRAAGARKHAPARSRVLVRSQKYDVVCVGGGAIGSSIADSLLRADVSVRLCHRA